MNAENTKPEKEIICILCPLGCKMQVKEKPGQPGELSLRGHQCAKGPHYAKEEFKNPVRTLTTTVAVKNASLARLPVKTLKPIPKGLTFAAMQEIAALTIEGPVKMGDTIIENLAGSGVKVVATRSLR